MVGTGDKYIDDQDGSLLWPYFRYFVLNRLFFGLPGYLHVKRFIDVYQKK